MSNVWAKKFRLLNNRSTPLLQKDTPLWCDKQRGITNVDTHVRHMYTVMKYGVVLLNIFEPASYSEVVDEG
jgi:hypothetical protein